MIDRTRRVTMDNVVRMSSAKDFSIYVQSVVMRSSPKIYNRYGNIILRFTHDLRVEAYNLAQLFWHLGLVPQLVRRSEQGIQTGRGEIIENVWELVLTKVGAICFEDNSDFADWYNKLWVNK